MQDIEPKQMTIGALAKAAGVSVETVRFYQRKGLLEEPARTSGYRKYTDTDVRTIRFVKRVQQLGFTLKDAQELLNLAVCNRETRTQLAEVSRNKIEEIEQKIADLKRMVEMLRQFACHCGSEALDDSHCILLDCFENNWECCDTTKRRKK